MSTIIVIEGPKGVGKTTLIEALRRTIGARVAALPSAYVVPGHYRPQDTPSQNLARALDFGPDVGRALLLTDCLTRFRVARQDGGTWLFSRYLPSTFVYQRGPVLELAGTLIPDLTLFLDAPEETTQARIKARGEPPHKAGLRVRYQSAIAECRGLGWPVEVIDASASADVVFEQALRMIREVVP